MAARAVLVTGASRGIGAAVARAFAASGDRVGVHYGSRGDAALHVRDSLAGSGHVVAGADLADPEAIRRMVDEVAGALGGIDVLVNNAGVFEPHAATQTSYEEWQAAWAHTLGVNLIGAANVTWCVLRPLSPSSSAAAMSVDTNPGATAVTEIRRSPRARASDCPNAISPALLAP